MENSEAKKYRKEVLFDNNKNKASITISNPVKSKPILFFLNKVIITIEISIGIINFNI